jgi:hypothetical protein
VANVRSSRLWATIRHLSQLHDRGGNLAGPGKGALGARVSGFPVAVHYRLEQGCEGRDPDARGYQDRVLGLENVAGRGSVRAVQVNLSTINGTITYCVLWPRQLQSARGFL